MEGTGKKIQGWGEEGAEEERGIGEKEIEKD